MTDINRLIQRLTDANIEFVIVGGFAAVLHGSSLLTRDLDVCTILSPDRVDKLRNALASVHPTHRFTPQRLSFLENPPPGTALKNLYLQTDLGAIDLLGEIAGVGDYEAVIKQSIEIDLFGRKVRVIGLSDLIRAKEAMNRDKDRRAVEELRAIQERSRT